jgi:hypothetical protein
MLQLPKISSYLDCCYQVLLFPSLDAHFIKHYAAEDGEVLNTVNHAQI